MNSGFIRQFIHAANNDMNIESSQASIPDQQELTSTSPRCVPDVTAHRYHTQEMETNRPVQWAQAPAMDYKAPS